MDWKTLVKSPQEWGTLKYDDQRLDAFAEEVEKRYELPTGIVVALKNAGERTNPNMVSPKGAKGIMQFTDSTRQLRQGEFDHDVNDPFQSIDAAGRYIKELIKENKGNPMAAIANYNGGPTAGKAVREGKEPPAKETQDYIKRIKEYLNKRYGGK
jgi:soluble lytic murein transglycosylase-like protein